MTPNYEDAPAKAPKKPGMPGWAWGLIGCVIIVPLIVVILGAAVMFPAFAQAREKARQTSCLSNCKIMGTAMMMYVQDNEEIYPPQKSDWMYLLAPYHKDMKVYKCPSYTTSPYGYAASQEGMGKKLEKIPIPAKLPVLFDSDVTAQGTVVAPDAIAFRHARKYANVTYADGHAKALKNPADN